MSARKAGERFVISPVTKQLFADVKQHMQKHVPALRGLALTQDYIIRRVFYVYLDIDPDTMLEVPHEKEKYF